jgi:transcriptional regulator with XRE-family HTH domain
MAQHVGTLLWEMRTRAGFSLGKLAQKAGLNKSTLSRWEAGVGQPRVPELEAVLAALGAGANQRALAFACIEAPRALRHLRQTAPDTVLGTPPSKGDLLQALRFRKGWTQEQTAAHLGVDRTAIAHWERGDRTPSNEQMQALCFTLDAQEEELIALTTKQGLAAPECVAALPFGEKVAWVEQRLAYLLAQPLLWGLEILILEREAWSLAAQKEEACPLLARVLAEHALGYRNAERWSEAGQMAQQALNLLPRQTEEPDFVLRAAIVSASVAVYSSPRPAPERGLPILLHWRQCTVLPEYLAWMLSDMAKYLMQAGQSETALDLARQARYQAEASSNPIEPYLRQMDLGRLLVQAGQPHAALAQFPEPLFRTHPGYAWDLMAHAEAHLRAGHLSEAHDWLQRAQEMIQLHAINHLRAQADTLAQQL